jgi:hypothetical protein
MRPLLALLLALALNDVRPAAAQPVVTNLETTPYATAAGAAGLTFGSDGRLFVGRDAPGSTAITEQLIFTVPPGGGATTEYGPFGIADPLAVLVDADAAFAPEVGSVIVSGPVDSTSGQLVAIKPSAAEPQPGATIAVIHPAASGGIKSGGYLARLGNTLLIADAAAEAVVRFPAPTGPPAALISTPGVTPRFLAVREPDTIFVSYDGGTIRRFDAAGAPVGPDPLVTGLAGAVPIAVAPADADFAEGLYAVEGSSGKLFRIADDGTKTEVGTKFPSSLGEIEFGPDGGLYVAAFSAGRVYRIGEPLPLPAAPDLGPYVCYNAKPAADSTPPPTLEVGLTDEFEARAAKIGKAKMVCSPATVAVGSAAPVVNQETATLASYQSVWKPVGGHVPQSLDVTNALGMHTVETKSAGADRVLVPSAFSTSATPAPLTPAARDFFQCYKAKLPKGDAPIKVSVVVADPLGPGSATPTPRTLVVRKPKHVCIPVDSDLDDQPIHRPTDLLVCYEAKPAKGEPKSAVRSGMHVGNARAPDQLLDMLKGATTSSTSTQTGTVRGDVVETFAGEGTTRPGEWDLEDSEGPRWSGGGPLGEGDWLKATFSDAETLPEGTVRRFRVFVEIDIVVNDTNRGPGVVMRSSGIPGIPAEEPIALAARASGKLAGVRRSSEWFDAPPGTTLAQLADSEQTFDPDGDRSDGAFAFQIKSFGIDYEMSVTTGGARTGVPEAELCLPPTTP